MYIGHAVPMGVISSMAMAATEGVTLASGTLGRGAKLKFERASSFWQILAKRARASSRVPSCPSSLR